MASGAAGGLVGLWVAMEGRRWPLGVAVDLEGPQVTNIMKVTTFVILQRQNLKKVSLP
jgi:hypothetical protein